MMLSLIKILRKRPSRSFWSIRLQLVCQGFCLSCLVISALDSYFVATSGDSACSSKGSFLCFTSGLYPCSFTSQLQTFSASTLGVIKVYDVPHYGYKASMCSSLSHNSDSLAAITGACSLKKTKQCREIKLQN